MPDAGSSSRFILVGRVLSPCLSFAAQILTERRSPNSQQRPEHAPRLRMNSGKARKPRAAHDVRQHRLSLVVRGLRNRHARNPPFLHKSPEKGVTRAPRRILKIRPLAFRFCRNVFARDEKLQLVLRGKLRNESLIRLRSLPAQLVVEMRNANNNPKRFAQFREQSQQRYRIRAARNRNADALPGANTETLAQ